MMIQTTSDIQTFLPVQKWLHELSSKSDFKKIEDIAKYGNNISLLCFYAGETFLAKKTIENLLLFFEKNTFGVDFKIAKTLALQPCINLLRSSRLRSHPDFNFMLGNLEGALNGKPFHISIFRKNIEINRDYLTNEGLSLLENCILAEHSKIALLRKDISACTEFLDKHPFAKDSSFFDEVRVILLIHGKDYEKASAICLDWLKKTQIENFSHIFYFWLMVLAQKGGFSQEAKAGLNRLIKVIIMKKKPSKIQTKILEKIFRTLVQNLNFTKAQELGKNILSIYQFKDDELAWASFAFENANLDFLDKNDKQRLFECWKETGYQSAYQTGCKIFPKAIDNFSERFGVQLLRAHTRSFCEFLSDCQKISDQMCGGLLM